jgi:hypothetical protein
MQGSSLEVGRTARRSRRVPNRMFQLIVYRRYIRIKPIVWQMVMQERAATCVPTRTTRQLGELRYTSSERACDPPVSLIVDGPLGTLDHMERVDEPGLFRQVVRRLMLYVSCSTENV